MEKESSFNGFSEELFKFLKDLKKNNSTAWFYQNKSRYQEFLVEPAKAFVSELAPFLNHLNPVIRSEPKFNQTLMRINKDMRFAKGDPYRNYFLIHFGRFKMDSEFYLYFDSDSVQVGLFLNNTRNDNLFFNLNIVKYRKEILDVFKRYELNNKYSLYTLEKEPELVLKKFNADKHLSRIEKINYILLQKTNNPSWKKIYSDAILFDVIKMISNLYPLYCFAVSRDPVKELNRFEETFGRIV